MLIKALTNPIYHYVKGFYHEHKNHTDDCDSILDAYVCTKESDSQISSPDNKPLIFYLRQYEKRFRDFTEQLEFDASYLMSILDSPDYRDVLYKEKFESFDARCIDILGEVVYYRALLYSHNNVSYHKALGMAWCYFGSAELITWYHFYIINAQLLEVFCSYQGKERMEVV